MIDRCSIGVVTDDAMKIIEVAAKEQYRDTFDRISNASRKLRSYITPYKFNLDEQTMTIEDPDGNTYPVSKLTSNAFLKKYGMLDDYIKDYANSLTNYYALIEKKASPNAFANIRANIEQACIDRMKVIKKYGDTAANLVGIYPVSKTSSLVLCFSTNVEDMFIKSTAQTWNPSNCERWGGQSEAGIFSDIAHNSIVVFLRKRTANNNRNAIARLMLRLCITDKGKPAYGYDKYWYRGNESHARYSVNDNFQFVNYDTVTARDLTKMVLSILDKKGFPVNYKVCITPFPHAGYSDVERKPNVPIAYSPYYVKCEFCGETIPVDENGEPRCPICGRRRSCRICGNMVLAEHFNEDANMCTRCYNEQQRELSRRRLELASRQFLQDIDSDPRIEIAKVEARVDNESKMVSIRGNQVVVEPSGRTWIYGSFYPSYDYDDDDDDYDED